jgi:hypothetical protein
LTELLFLYREVLGMDLRWLNGVHRPRTGKRIPSVLTVAEAAALLSALPAATALLARLPYGTVSYKMKLPVYAIENVLVQTMNPDFYKNNPDVARFIAAKPGVKLWSVADYEKSSIAARGDSYTALAELIWTAP